MQGNSVTDISGRRHYRVVVLAQESSSVNALARQLEVLNCAVECTETLADAQSVVDREAPHFAFIECQRFPTRMREVTSLFRVSDSADSSGPWLIGVGCEDCAPGDPGACGLDDHLRLPTDLDKLEAVLGLRHAGASSAGGPGGCRGLSVSEKISQLPHDVQIAMLTAFVDYTSARLARIETGFKEYDLERVARDVHAVKSGCLQMGYTSMVECCEEMRRAIDANDVCTAEMCYRVLVAAFKVIAGEVPRN